MEINEIIDKLKKGNERFTSGTPERKPQDTSQRKLLVTGQSPFAVILGCADSRVVPEFIFDTGLGEIFTVRVAGNVANVASIASIEFAVSNLNVKLVLVLGHSNCGAVSAAVDGGDLGYNLNSLLTHITPAIEQTPGGSIDEIIKKNAELNADELVKRSAIIAEAVKSGKLKIVPTYYHLESGEVEFLTD
ncbi:MAG: carbonic anhydrase [Ignavibacteriae bacterium]|nr:MAG: carbonic anhydrase [Ignavibacteriota bacterium]